MTLTQILSAQNVAIAAAPPSEFLPDSNGIVLTSTAALGYQVETNSPGYSSGSSADLFVEVRLKAGNVWKQVGGAGGYTLGQYIDSDSHLSVTTNHFSFTAQAGLRGHTRARVRVDRVPAGTIATVTVFQVT